ncbi:MAG: calcium-binding protein [Pseudomonadota bacterium]
MFGGAGDDWVKYAGSTGGVTVSLLTNSGSGGHASGDTLHSIEHLQGSTHADVLTGDNTTANQLFGSGGNDNIFGGGGHDFLLGQDGDDAIYGGSGRDVMRGGAGADHLDGGSEDDWVQYHDANAGVSLSLLTGTGTAGDAAGDTFTSVEHVKGTGYADTISGNAARNIFLAGDGDDLITGNGGNDLFYGESGNDTLIGSSAGETFYGGAGSDDIQGGGGNDWLRFGDAGAGISVSLLTGTGSLGDAAGDTIADIEFLWGSDFSDTLEGDHAVNMIRGGAGDDTITGHGGNDILQGHDGSDTFVFHTGDGTDRIHEYEIGIDRLHIMDAASFADLTVFDFRGDAAITYSPGGTILLTGIDEAMVSSGMFLFG